jgi:hypothetical protein
MLGWVSGDKTMPYRRNPARITNKYDIPKSYRLFCGTKKRIRQIRPLASSNQARVSMLKTKAFKKLNGKKIDMERIRNSL